MSQILSQLSAEPETQMEPMTVYLLTGYSTQSLTLPATAQEGDIIGVQSLTAHNRFKIEVPEGVRLQYLDWGFDDERPNAIRSLISQCRFQNLYFTFNADNEWVVSSSLGSFGIERAHDDLDSVAEDMSLSSMQQLTQLSEEAKRDILAHLEATGHALIDSHG